MLRRLYNLILNDKFQHFVYGIAIYALVLPFGLTLAFTVLVLIALLKEHLDSKGYGVMEYKDALYTVAGGVYLQSWYILFETLSKLF